jgi:hypothetical protein
MKSLSAVRLVATCVGLFILLPDAGARIARASAPGQAEALARLVWGILACETHPCGEDSDKRVRSLLQNRIVSEGTFEYSDLAVTYPDKGADLRGVVEWDFSGGEVDEISLITVGFDDRREVLKSAMEATLPGCIIDSTPADDDDAPADAPSAAASDSAASADSAAAAIARPVDWDCTVDLPGDRKADITIHVARETLFLEVL